MSQDRLDRIEALLERFITASDERLTRLERDIGDLRASISDLRDLALGRAAELALSQSQMVGTESFTAELKRLADGEA